VSKPNRTEVLSDLRMLLNWLEANPDVPVVRFDAHISHCIGGDDDEVGIKEIHRIADAAGVEVTRSGEHHRVSVEFGAARYEAYYVERQHMADYSEFMKPYHERQIAKRAAEATP